MYLALLYSGITTETRTFVQVYHPSRMCVLTFTEGFIGAHFEYGKEGKEL